MGLDMYLYKRNYVKNWTFQKDSEKHEITIKKGGEIREDIVSDRIVYVTEQIGYWRKFNGLHNWIIKNVANGNDDCQEIFLNFDVMKDLLDVLSKVKDSLDKSEKNENGIFKNDEIALELLPPAEGFFFGSQEIDEWYYNEICKSIAIFNEAIKGQEDITYNASW